MRLRFVALLLAPLLLLAACVGPPAQTLEYTVEATSSTTVRVTFSRTVGPGAAEVSNYNIEASDGTALAVVTAFQRDAITVLLGTAPQVEGAEYTLSFQNILAADSGSPVEPFTEFVASSETAPILASAIALNPNEILLTFGTPTSNTVARMGDSAIDVANYDIVEENPTLDETPDLSIESARFGVDDKGDEDRGRVILTTETHIDTLYTVRAVNITGDTGDKLIDPWFSTAEFRGIPEEDAVAPQVLRATSVDNTHVLVDFNEPIVGGDTADRYAIVDDTGAPLEVLAAEYTSPYKTQVLLTTSPQRDERTEYTVTVSGVSDRQGNPLDPNANSATFLGTFRTGPIDGDVVPPRVSNTGSSSNTEVLVTFTEPVDSTSAEDPVHYRITASLADGRVATQATLLVLSAELRDNRTTVALTTMAQSDLQYTLEVTNVTDLAGNQIAPPDRFNDPSSLTFHGTPPNGPQVDSDCDGLSDAAEQRGWVVTVINTDGTSTSSEVTSDPGDPAASCVDNAASQDTDGDGLDDYNERIYVTDPRNTDTDADGLDDNRELNAIYSEPSQQDSDGDGLGDGLEVDFFGTSPLTADTDGDQFDDGAEVTTQNRNPLIADLPLFDMQVVGDVQLGLDVRFTAESSEGSRVLETRSSQASLSTESSRTNSFGSSHTAEWFINAGAKIGVEYEPIASFKFTGEVSVEGGYKESSTTEFSSQSVRATQQAQESSRSSEAEAEQGESVTREVVGASMAVSLEFVSVGDIAFTIDNLEVTAKLVDPRDPTRFIPVATLFSSGGAITLGPAPDARGPIRFVADSPAPALIEALRENPRNLLFVVSNYDIVDEFGRNFSFTYQDVNDSTAQLFVDYGGRLPAELERVATYSAFDADGDALGVTMRTVLEEILGLSFVPAADDPALTACLDGSSTAACSPEDRARINSSYSVRDNGAGLIQLHRLRSVVTNVADGFRWFVDVELEPGAVEPDNFRDLVVTSGRSFRFLYGQDLDGDGLTVQQEAFYGSADSRTDALNNACFGDPSETGCSTPDGVPDSVDTDRDGIDDNEEVFGRELVADPMGEDDYEPWLVIVRGEDAVETSASPARFDTDGDGLTDCQELGRCAIYVYLYPNDSTDTPGADQAALRAALETDPQSGIVVGLYRDGTGRPDLFGAVPPAWTLNLTGEALTDPSRFDSDGDGLSDTAELLGVRYLPIDADIGDLPVQLFPGIGALLSRPTPLAELSDVATDPLVRDSDGDLLIDGVEVQIGIDPTDPASTDDAALDNDGDGLRNIEEDAGWIVIFRNSVGVWVDGTGAPLYVDGSNALIDSSGVRIPTDELGNPVDILRVRLADGATIPARIASDRNRADADFDGLPDSVERALYSDPNRFDTDGDGLGDGEEFSGVAFPSDPVDPARFTNPLDFDSDDDRRSDGVEIGTPWTVVVRGSTPYQVFSDPLIDDADLDGLSDLQEAAEGTDPSLADTDGDGVGDFQEVFSTVLPGQRSPIVPDQVVEFRYSNGTILNSCYLIPGESSLGGWTAGSNGWFSDLRYSRFGGSAGSGGYLWILSSNLFFGSPSFLFLNAPLEYTGDLGPYYGGSFSFDLREFLEGGDQTRFDPDLNLTGNGLSIVYDNPVHEDTSWTTVSVPLTEAGWTKVSDGSAVSEAEFRGVLGAVTQLSIAGAYEAPEQFWDTLLAGVGFDNPTLAAPGLTTFTNDFEDGAFTAGNFRGRLNLEIPQSDGSLLVPPPLVDLSTVLSGVASGNTVPLAGTVETFVVGLDQGFRAFSTTIYEESEAFTLGLDVEAVANYDSFSQTYDYPVTGGNDSITLRGEKPEMTSGTCELSLSWSWRVLE